MTNSVSVSSLSNFLLSSKKLIKKFYYSTYLPTILILIILIFTISLSSPSRAAGGLVVTPQLVELNARNRNTVLTLANRGNKVETYRISIINYRMDEQGNLFQIDTPSGVEAFANGLFRYAPRQITLKPGTPQTVRVLYRRPADLEEGEYRSHLLFQQVPDTKPQASNNSSGAGLSVEIKTIFGISIPVIVRHGELTGNGQLAELKSIDKNDGEKAISLRINRSGNQSLRGDLVALSDGNEVGRLNNVAVYLSTAYRDIEVPLTTEKLLSLSGKTIDVEYRPRKGKTGPIITSSLRLP
ncbi:molecular chaperone [Kiloniella sp.]|uniref:fimbrial biogenesis chaperone n=1 Tax=Kiloniella sp. TaxID=1938587 RepID=UPI003B02D671